MALAIESDKVMFEIYREAGLAGRYRVVYFTELNDHNREMEINNAMRGEHFYDGFIRNYGKEQAKQHISQILQRMNSGENLARADIERELKPYVP